MRPLGYQTLQNVPKVDKLSIASMDMYLRSPDHQDIIDEDGNTHLHRIALHDRTEVIEDRALDKPQELFIVNRMGQTPLDICIEDDESCKIIKRKPKEKEEMDERFRMYTSIQIMHQKEQKSGKSKMSTRVGDEAQLLGEEHERE